MQLYNHVHILFSLFVAECEQLIFFVHHLLGIPGWDSWVVPCPHLQLLGYGVKVMDR